jgi:nucleoid-associated protein YgaU
VLTSLTIDYTLFRPDGTPLRATLKASFTEYTTPALEQLQNFLSSPDVTHVRTITATDRLDLMSYNIYKDSKYYMELARVNNLNNFRKLKVGDKIVFPPIEKNK